MASYLVLVACIAVAVASPTGNYGSHGSASNYVGGSSSGYSGGQSSASSYAGSHQSSSSGYSGNQQSSASGYSGGRQGSAGGYSGGQSSAGGYSAPVVPILSQEGNINDDGSYHFRYETGDYSARQEQADAYNYVQGSYNYIAPDGQKIYVTYTADQNGFQAQGDHLPTPVPSPYPFNMIIGGQGGQYGGSHSAPQYGGAQSASQYGGAQSAPQYGGAQQHSGGNAGY